MTEYQDASEDLLMVNTLLGVWNRSDLSEDMADTCVAMARALTEQGYRRSVTPSQGYAAARMAAHAWADRELSVSDAVERSAHAFGLVVIP